MKELVFLENSVFKSENKDYLISTFIDVYNYKILRATDLINSDKLEKGKIYKCDLDVKYDSKKKDFVFKVVKAY